MLIKHSDAQIPNFGHIDSFPKRIDLCSKHSQVVNTGNTGNHNNSTGGSDSGVDSGAGIIIPSESHLRLSSSPIKDPDEMEHRNDSPPIANGHNITTGTVNKDNNNSRYGVITFSPKNTIKYSEQLIGNKYITTQR
ncbi:unnamed protein product [Heterobilharzia americana]|nr:unnamed protein product [Heterobilharzia americana]